MNLVQLAQAYVWSHFVIGFPSAPVLYACELSSQLLRLNSCSMHLHVRTFLNGAIIAYYVTILSSALLNEIMHKTLWLSAVRMKDITSAKRSVLNMFSDEIKISLQDVVGGLALLKMSDSEADRGRKGPAGDVDANSSVNIPRLVNHLVRMA
jgi:hypothetical protein